MMWMQASRHHSLFYAMDLYGEFKNYHQELDAQQHPKSEDPPRVLPKTSLSRLQKSSYSYAGHPTNLQPIQTVTGVTGIVMKLKTRSLSQGGFASHCNLHVNNRPYLRVQYDGTFHFVRRLSVLLSTSIHCLALR